MTHSDPPALYSDLHSWAPSCLYDVGIQLLSLFFFSTFPSTTKKQTRPALDTLPKCYLLLHVCLSVLSQRLQS